MKLSSVFEKIEPFVLEYEGVLAGIREAKDAGIITVQEALAASLYIKHLVEGRTIIDWLINQGVPSKNINKRTIYAYYTQWVPHIIASLKQDESETPPFQQTRWCTHCMTEKPLDEGMFMLTMFWCKTCFNNTFEPFK